MVLLVAKKGNTLNISNITTTNTSTDGTSQHIYKLQINVTNSHTQLFRRHSSAEKGHICNWKIKNMTINDSCCSSSGSHMHTDIHTCRIKNIMERIMSAASEDVINSLNVSFVAESIINNLCNGTGSNSMTHSSMMSSSTIISSVSPSAASVTSFWPSAITSSLMPTMSPSPTVICEAEGVWPPTNANEFIIVLGVSDCFNGSVKANRSCGQKGDWEDYQCVVTQAFNETLNRILDSPVDGLQTLVYLITIDEITVKEFVFLLNTALETVLESPDIVLIQAFNEIFLNAADFFISGIVSQNNTDPNMDKIRRNVGSQLLLTLDRFALNLAKESSSGLLKLSEFLLMVTEISEGISNDVIGIEVEEGHSISLPQMIFNEAKVRVGSFLFRGLSDLLPPVDTNSSIISPIISSTIDCQSCPVTDLTQNVTIRLKIERSPSNNERLECAFFDFNIRVGNLVPTGDWNTSGCTTVTVDGNLVTCSCNHLTHFAILLSPGGPEISPIHYKVLTTIGLVLVPISLLCMVMVILTYSLIRSLWSLRNYVHIMLCVSLFMAQLVFIIGVDKIENQGVCSAVAVILVYLFLVTFMWMLMEGVVLYVTLVRVFITNHKYYVISFTVASYVIPAVYMAVIIPIGYVVNVENITHHTQFLYYHDDQLTGCWLNYSTGFVWCYIAPVIVIILVNIGFFVMAIVIMRKHTKKQEMRKNATKLRHWLKASISLTLVMGISWLVGVMAFRRELLPVAYIITIFIAAQGILLFIILVLLSKQVREAYYKVWVTKRSQSTFLTKLSDFANFSSLTASTVNSNKPAAWKSNGGVKQNNHYGTGGGMVLGTIQHDTTQLTNSLKDTPLQDSTVDSMLNNHTLTKPQTDKNCVNVQPISMPVEKRFSHSNSIVYEEVIVVFSDDCKDDEENSSQESCTYCETVHKQLPPQ